MISMKSLVWIGGLLWLIFSIGDALGGWGRVSLEGWCDAFTGCWELSVEGCVSC